jgi:hypothetical protein
VSGNLGTWVFTGLCATGELFRTLGGGLPTSWEELRCLILPVVTLSMIPM